MKKFIKILLIIAVILVAAVFILSLIGPKTYELKRSALMKAPKESIWEQVSKWENFGNWSPWEAKDSAMTKTIEGTPGEVGSKYTWKSKTQGNGVQTILESKPYEYRLSSLEFEDWGMKSKTSFELKDSAGGTFVTWKMFGENGFMGRIMSLIFNMEKMVGPDYEAGLANIKRIVESAPAAAPAEMPAENEKDSTKN
ncbi:MAG: SRPBCC family protein [Bacteroidia bacterium]|nr:SRPBCC family protein [Bacteroidia bacterium]